MLHQQKKPSFFLENYSLEILAHIAEAVWVVGQDYTLLACNQCFIDNAKTFFGYEFVVGKSVLETEESEESKFFWKERYDACFAGATIQEADTYPALDLVLKIHIVPFYNDAKNIAAICFSSNLKETKETAQQLIHNKKELFDNQHRQAGFLAKLNHELRTPLNGIMGLAHLLLHENPTDEQTVHLKKLLETAQHLAEIAQDTLNFIDLPENNTQLNEKSFSLHQLLQGVSQTFEPLAKNKKIGFYLEIDNGVPDWVNGDDTRIVQMVEHLLNNALAFTSKGHIILMAEAQPQEINDFITFRISIKDTGIGIAPNKLTQILDIFQPWQDNQTNTAHTGSLFLVKKLLERLKGQIHINSMLGKGTTFTCDIPLRSISNSPAHLVMPKDIKLPSLIGLRVLFVEDNILNQRWTGKFLQNWDIAVDYASNGRQAVEKVRNCLPEHFYHAILMDIHLPELDGYEATKKIRAYTQVPIIALTAALPQTAKRKAVEVGMNDFISKPFSPKLLHEKLTEHTAYELFAFSDTMKYKKLVDFETIIDFADGDLAYQQEVFELYKNFFTEFPIQFEEALKSQNMANLKRLEHKSRPSIKLLHMDCLENELNQAIIALETKQSLPLQSVQIVKKYCTLCLIHLKIYAPNIYES